MEARRIMRPLAATESGRQLKLPPTMVHAEYVDKQFAKDVGVFDLSFEVPTGTIFGLIGPSGCGKTTTVRLMTGLYKPDRGRLEVLKRAPSKFSPRARELLGYMPQHFVLYPNLTVWENLNFVASLYGMGYFKRRRPLEQALEFVELSDVRNRLGSQLSSGMQRRLELACTLAHNPLLIFADEPTAGIDPVLRGKFWNHFRQLRDQGRTLFLTTQYVGEATYCDLVAIMRAGRIMHLDTPENLRKKALGGEVIKLVVDPPHALDAAQIFQRHPAVKDVRRSRSQPGLLYLYTEDAAATLPLIFEVMSEHPEITVQQADKYVPPFDDIFVQLMEQAEEHV
ncbi:MAG TPA: ABC transporter ATP-binding protein [Roseiflexaceae bacterium]|nr:ABC transporter ATP-binding protein [Roseiflexaceae bacterium]